MQWASSTATNTNLCLNLSFSNRDFHGSDITTSGDIINTNKIDYYIWKGTEDNILLFVENVNQKAMHMNIIMWQTSLQVDGEAQHNYI